MWVWTKTIKKGDYLYAVIPSHPKSTKYGYVLEHRAVAENKIGRVLAADEVVHHINHNRKDNRPENLQVMGSQAHRKLHAKKGRSYVNLVCSQCGAKFVRERRQVHAVSIGVVCSRKCNGKRMQRNLIRARGRTDQVPVF